LNEHVDRLEGERYSPICSTFAFPGSFGGPVLCQCRGRFADDNTSALNFIFQGRFFNLPRKSFELNSKNYNFISVAYPDPE
jgi:hypothetical protein